MKTKILLTIFIILIAVFVPAGFFIFLPKEIKIQDVKNYSAEKPLKVDITYPQIAGLTDFNNKAKAIIDKEFNSFRENSLANDEAVKKTDPEGYAKYPREYELDISYTKGEINKNIISIIFNIYNFEGGAHGNGYFVALNYDVNNKKEIKLADLFLDQTDYLKKISEYCITDLTKQLTTTLGSTEGTWILEGAGPKEENFQYFLINPDNTITFYFPKYQVAYGATGDFKVVYSR